MPTEAQPEGRSAVEGPAIVPCGLELQVSPLRRTKPPSCFGRN